MARASGTFQSDVLGSLIWDMVARRMQRGKHAIRPELLWPSPAYATLCALADFLPESRTDTLRA